MDSILNLRSNVHVRGSIIWLSRHEPIQLTGMDGICSIIQSCPITLLFLEKVVNIDVANRHHNDTVNFGGPFLTVGGFAACSECGLLKTAESRIRGRKSDASMANQMQWWVKFWTNVEKIGPKVRALTHNRQLGGSLANFSALTKQVRFLISIWWGFTEFVAPG
jgi:hypothetical protein